MMSMRKVNNQVNMAKALERSLAMLGEPSKKTVLFHLTHTFKVPIERKNCSIEEIEGALKQILGEGASLVVASINNEIKQETR